MIRPIKKMCSFVLAVSLAWTSVSVPAAADTNNKANDTKWQLTDDIVTFIEPVYDDECFIYGGDEAAFVENGKFYEEATTDTNIVFVDRDGNKNVLSNDNGKGEKLFDEIYPAISDYRLFANVLELVKNNKITFMNFRGEYVGGEAKYYNYAEPISETAMLVSDDDITYRIINKQGEITVDNIKNIDKSWGGLRDFACIYLLSEDKTYVIDKDGNLLMEFDEEIELYDWAKEYDVIRRLSDDIKIVINAEGNVLKELDDSFIEPYTGWKDGYLKYSKNIEESGKLVDKYFVEDVITNKILTEAYSSPEVDGNLIVAEVNKGVKSLFNLDGTVYIEDINQLFYELLEKEDCISEDGSQVYVEKKHYLKDDKFIASLAFGSARDVSYVYTWSDDGAKCDVKRFEGQYMNIYSDYIVTKYYNGDIKNIYSLDGELIKGFEEGLYDGIYYIGIGKNLFGVYGYYEDGYTTSYVTSTGEVSKEYRSINRNGQLIFAEDFDEITYVINSNNEIIYKGANVWCDEVSNETLTAFIVKNYADNLVYIYDENGTLLFSGENAYTMDFDSDLLLIVDEESEQRKYGLLRISDNISISDAEVKLSDAKYTYTGKAVKVKIDSVVVDGVTLKEGKDYIVSYKNNVKVGKATVVITGKGDYKGTCSANFEIVYGTGMYKDTDGKWHYYINGNIDKSYVGLAKNAYGWWYMNKGNLDTSYTGLVKYKTNWLYVKNGKLDSTYTGLVKYKSNWVYVNKGNLVVTYTGMAKNPYGWWYVAKGKLDLGYIGIAKNPYGTWYLKNGKLDLTFTGKVTVSGKTYTIKNGKVK